MKIQEKIYLYGKSNLSDAELLALMMPQPGSERTRERAQKLYKAVNYDLSALSKLQPEDLQRYGLTRAAAQSIVAAFELCRRTRRTSEPIRPQITGSRDAHEILMPYFEGLQVEKFYILLLNRANRVLKVQQISEGGIAGTVVDGKVIFKAALLHGASSIILAHNHPSGNLKPSQADINVTAKLKKAGEAIDITVLDHLIISGNFSYYSFADDGAL